MRDETDLFDGCGGWTEAGFIQHFSQTSMGGYEFSGDGFAPSAPRVSPSLIFELAIQGRVADLQHAMTFRAEAPGAALAPNMPELFSTIGLLEESWKARRITFSEAIRGLFAIRAVVQNLESGRAVDASAMHFFGSGLVGLADGEEHVFGAQIVAEKLYVNGWRTNVNVTGGLQWLIKRASGEYFDFVGISVGCDESLAGLADKITQLRYSSVNRSVDVILGGAVFAYSDQSFDFLGADHVAKTADDAVRYLNTRVKVTGAFLSH
jgi:methanogenic corrinoid protein MtbC1